MEFPPAPPDCGRRLLVNIIEERAANQHARPLYSVPKTKHAADGFHEISYWKFANAINRTASWILKAIGPPTCDFESLVYVGPLDLRYQLLIMAAVKTGYVMFLPSPRNSLEAFDSMLESCTAKKLVTTGAPMSVVNNILARRAMTEHVMPALEALLDDSPAAPVAYSKTFNEGRMDPFVRIHTSGSTGDPRVITLKHGLFCCIDGYQSMEPNEMGQRVGNQRLLSPFPQFHVAGILYQLTIPIFVDSTVVCAPSVPLTADVINDVHVHGNVEFSSLAPSLVADLCKNPTYLQNLGRLKGVNYAGGPLSDATGEIVVQHTKLTTNIGATEYGATPLLPKDAQDWRYFRFNEEAAGMQFQLQDETSGLYEMVFVRRKELDLLQPIFVTFPELEEYHTKDLFAKHPSKPGLWKYTSRRDDVIVLANGENLNPVSMEGAITASPSVKGCVIIGQGRTQAVCLLEPTEAAQDLPRGQFVDQVWPTIEKANKSTSRFGKISRDAVIVTAPGKPLPRAGKGTIQRAAANTLYANEVSQIFKGLDSGSAVGTERRLDLKDRDTTKLSLIEFLGQKLGVDNPDPEHDLIDYGLDSMQVIALMRAINVCREARSEQPIDVKQIYDNSTIRQLVELLQAAPAKCYDYDSDDEAQKEAWTDMGKMYEDFVDEVGRPKRRGKERIQSSNGGPVYPPDGGWEAWLQVLGSFLINFNNWGLVNAFGVFQAYYESTLSESSLSISFIGTLQGALVLLIGFISGPLFDAGYFSLMLSTASVGTVFALMMLSLADRYWQYMLCQGVLLGICSGLLYIPSVAVVPVYFKNKRGLALGVALSGGSFGGIIYPISFRRLLETSSLGFGWAVRVMGFIALGTLGVAVLIMKSLGPRSRRRMFDMSAFREMPYTAFAIAAFLIYAALLVPFFFVATYAESELHTSEGMSFYMLAILNTGQLFGRILPSWYTDFHPAFGPEMMLASAELICGLLAFCWIAIDNLGGFVPWSLVYGFASGPVTALPAIVLPYLCPNLAMYGTRLGMVYACAGLGLLISTPVAAGANSSTGGFLGAQIWTGSICFTALAMFTVAGMQARKRRLLYELGRGSRRHV